MTNTNLEQKTKGKSPRIFRGSWAGMPFLEVEGELLDVILYDNAAFLLPLAKFVGAGYGIYSALNGNFKTAAISTGVALGAHFLEKWIENRDDIKYGKHIEEFVKRHPDWYKD